MSDLPGRDDAIRILEEGHAKVRGLVDGLPPRARTRGGLGGGDWSPKDLVGHLASWEEYALDALAAWDADRGAPIDKELWSSSLGRVNAAAVARKARLSTPEVLRRADRTHAELIARMRGLSRERWANPATSRGRKPLGGRLGGILGGPSGSFRHAEAHLKDLEAFVAAQASV